MASPPTTLTSPLSASSTKSWSSSSECLQRSSGIAQLVGPIGFLSKRLVDLVILRGNQLEVAEVTADHPRLQHQWTTSNPWSSSVLALQALVARAGQQHVQHTLVAVTSKMTCTAVRYDPEAQRAMRVAERSLSTDRSVQVEAVRAVAVDDNQEILGVHLYEAMLHLVQFNEPGEDLQVTTVDLSAHFGSLDALALLRPMPSCTASTQVVLRVLTVHCGMGAEHRVACCELASGPNHAASSSHRSTEAPAMELRPMRIWDIVYAFKANSDEGERASFAMSVAPSGRIVVAGGRKICIFDRLGALETALDGGPPQAFAAAALGRGNDARWIVASEVGELFDISSMMGSIPPAAPLQAQRFAFPRAGCDSRWRVAACGSVSPRSRIVYLGYGLIFAASQVCDSHLVRFGAARCEGQGRQEADCAPNVGQCEILEALPNHGPIVDFCLAEVCGQRLVAACCGFGEAGSMRLMAAGAVVEERGSVDGMSSALRLWHLGGPCSAVAVGFLGSTVVLAWNADALELVEHAAPGFRLDCRSLLCAGTARAIMQVTPSEVIIMHPLSLLRVAQWSPAQSAAISAACQAGDRVLICTNGSVLVLLELQQPTLNHKAEVAAVSVQVVATCHLDDEVSCMACCGPLCAIGMWNRQVRLLRLPSLECFGAAMSSLEAIPRSLAISLRSDGAMLIISLGNADVLDVTVSLDTGQPLHSAQRHRFGSRYAQLLSLAVCMAEVELNFAVVLAERPALAQATPDGSVKYTPFPVQDLRSAVMWKAKPYRDSCLMFLSGDRLVIASLSLPPAQEGQLLHWRVRPLQASPFKVCFMPRARLFGLACQPLVDEAKDGQSVAQVQLLSSNTLDVVEASHMRPHEFVRCICCADLELSPGWFLQDDSLPATAECLLVGTGVETAERAEAGSGRILIYSGSRPRAGAAGASSQSRLVSSSSLSGGVSAIASVRGFVIGSVQGKVAIYRPSSSRALHLVSSVYLGGLPLSLEPHSDMLLCTDMCQSITLLRFEEVAKGVPKLKIVTQHSTSYWPAASTFLRQDLIACFDDECNVRLLQMDGQDEEKLQLTESSCKPFGHFINHAEATSQHFSTAVPYLEQQSSSMTLATAVWASADGSLGLLHTLSKVERAT